MNLCRCERGHFYDKEKYASCPHCAGGSAADDKLTEAFTLGVTVPAGDGPDVPGGMPGSSVPQPPVDSVPVQPVPIQPVPVQPVMPVVPQRTFPVPGMSANQVTVGMPGMNADEPTVPLEPEPTAPVENDDCTVGFFDDMFNAAPANTGSRTPSKASAPVPVANKVSTPCVGWLIALGGEHLGTDFRLKVGKNFIGRSQQMDIALAEDKSVSRDRHAIVVYEPKAHLYLVQPGESSSLVYRNNEVVLTPMKLDAYDVITVGDVNLLFIPLCGERFNWGDLFESMKKKDK